MKKYLKSEDGFTLVEVLIVLVIVAAIGMTLANILTGSDKAFRYSYSQSENAMAAQNALSAIVSELKYGTLLTPASNGASSSVTYTNTSGKNCSISLDASKSIVITNGSSSTKLASGLIKTLTFTRGDSSVTPERITINLSVNGDVSGSKTFAVSTTVVLLNM